MTHSPKELRAMQSKPQKPKEIVFAPTMESFSPEDIRVSRAEFTPEGRRVILGVCGSKVDSRHLLDRFAPNGQGTVTFSQRRKAGSISVKDFSVTLGA